MVFCCPDKLVHIFVVSAIVLMLTVTTSCKHVTNEPATETEVAGPPGPQGPKGERGDKGDKGDKGDSGPSGRGPLIVKANGVTIGDLVFIHHLSSTSRRAILVKNDKKYIFPVLLDPQYGSGSHAIDWTFVPRFISSDCSGTPYIEAGSFFNGLVVALNVGGGRSLYYVARDAQASFIPINSTWQSFLDPDVCVPSGGFSSYLLPLTPNDAAITGVTEMTFAPPLTIE